MQGGRRRLGGPRRLVRRLVSRAVWPDASAHAGARRVVAHEWFTVLGGSDKVAARLARLARAEVVYTFALDPTLPSRLDMDVPVVTWRFGAAAARSSRFHLYLALMPFVWWALDLDEAETLVTSSHSCVNAAVAPNAARLSYVHTPMRYAWEVELERGRIRPPIGWLLPAVGAIFRPLDRRWNRRVDVLVANSDHIAERIQRAYGRTCEVIAPPIDVDFWCPAPEPPGDDDSVDVTHPDASSRPYLVVAGRLIRYKRPDLAVAAAQRAGIPIVVAGGGPMRDELTAMAGPTTSLREFPDDEELRDLLRGAIGLVFPGIEDFGMLPVEAQACGTPVIARAAGGAVSTVTDSVTGTLVTGDDVEVWADELRRFAGQRFDRDVVRKHALRFSADRFDDEMLAALDRVG